MHVGVGISVLLGVGMREKGFEIGYVGAGKWEVL